MLEALSLPRTLHATYRDRDGKLTRPVLQPQALLQRGPRLYLQADATCHVAAFAYTHRSDPYDKGGVSCLSAAVPQTLKDRP
ncbi:hypothetical protein [Zoogloea sp.]|uniref:hypothetical protein n=1 Tax=Zoogloea sp. TaxID=49181 RepID=UPI0035B430F0